MVLSGPAEQAEEDEEHLGDTDSGSDEGGYRPEEKFNNTGQSSRT